ncbi:MAG: hypothetical protein GTO14_25675 [Anaerolineales bacterium]|nr:hypothetical protein [Anaerolineales bacterium]
MNTTSLFVELLIIGFEVVVWLVLFLGAATGSLTWIACLFKTFKNFEVLLTALVFALAYFLGILVDKIAKWLMEESPPGKRLQKYIDRSISQPRPFQKMYADVMVQEGEPMSDLIYARSKVRILRASILNLPLIALFVGLFMEQISQPETWWQLWVIAGIGALLTGLTFFVYLYNQRLYRGRLRLFAKFSKRKNKSKRRD